MTIMLDDIIDKKNKNRVLDMMKSKCFL